LASARIEGSGDGDLSSGWEINSVGGFCAGAGEPRVGLGETDACLAASRTHASASSSLSLLFFPSIFADTPAPKSLLKRPQVPDGAEPILARPRPIPAFFFGDEGTTSEVGSLTDGALKPTAKLFRLAKYPDGLRSAEDGRDTGAAEGVLEDWKGAFLLGESGFGLGAVFATGAGVGDSSAAGSATPNHFPARACRFAGLGLSRSSSTSLCCCDGRGRFAGEVRDADEGSSFLGDVRETGGANAAENVGFAFVFEGELDDLVGEGARGVNINAVEGTVGAGSWVVDGSASDLLF